MRFECHPDRTWPEIAQEIAQAVPAALSPPSADTNPTTAVVVIRVVGLAVTAGDHVRPSMELAARKSAALAFSCEEVSDVAVDRHTTSESASPREAATHLAISLHTGHQQRSPDHD